MSGSSLGPNQRTRLMQSSRKIEAILGVTPQFVELQPATARPHSYRRDGRMFTQSSNSSNSSVNSFGDSTDSLIALPTSKPKLSLKVISGGIFASSAKVPKTPKSSKQAVAAPPPLIIHYQALGQGCDPRASIISVLPAEEPSSDLRSPLSPSSANPVDFRRRRMAKLARTLGENVPPELVFHDLAQNDRKQLRAARGRSWSVGSHLNSLTPVVSRKPSIMKVSYETDRPESRAFNDYTDRCLSRTESYTSEMSRSNTPFSQHTLDYDNTRRKHREWSGEWNTNNMDNVIESLRDLRAK